MLLTVQEVTSEDEREVFRELQKYVLKCKEVAWIIFYCRDLVTLRERHNLSDKHKLATNHIGDVVIIKGESKNGQHWKLIIVEKLHSVKNNVIRAVGLQTKKKYLEQPIQLLYPMELHCSTVRNTEAKLNPNVEESSSSQLKRKTAAVAKVKIQDIQPEGDDI